MNEHVHVNFHVDVKGYEYQHKQTTSILRPI